MQMPLDTDNHHLLLHRRNPQSIRVVFVRLQVFFLLADPPRKANTLTAMDLRALWSLHGSVSVWNMMRGG